jgi:methionine-rich copper-binding protein CopC
MHRPFPFLTARGRGAAALLLALAALAAPFALLAHARMLRSVPADKAVLEKSPEKIEMWFNELLDRSFNSVEVFPASEVRARARKNFAKGPAQVDEKDRTHLSVEVAPLPPGEYMVEWRVLSRDGHSAPGRFTFRVTEKK